METRILGDYVIANPVTNLASLKSVIVSTFVTSKNIIVMSDLGLFHYDSTSTADPDDKNVVLPNEIVLPNPGRWIITTFSLSDLGAVTNDPTGFRPEDLSKLNVTIDDPSRTISLTPTASDFNFYVKGIEYIKTGIQTKVFSDTQGLHFIYYDDAGTLNDSVYFEGLLQKNALVAVLYWDETNKNSNVYFTGNNELHGVQMDGATHDYLHEVFGTRYISGLALGNFSIDGTGDIDSDAQFSFDSGVIRDEDIFLNINSIISTVGCRGLYRVGASGDWVDAVNPGFSMITTGTGRLAWNEFTGGVWQLSEVPNLDFSNIHIVATNGESQYRFIVGQATYGTIIDARQGSEEEASNLKTDGLPFAEWVLVATVIVQTSNIYSNAVKSRIRSTGDPAPNNLYIDWTKSQIGPGTGSPSDHANLSNLDYLGSGHRSTFQRKTAVLSTPPTINEDDSAGYDVGSLIIDSTDDSIFICIDSTTGSAVWQKISKVDSFVSADRLAYFNSSKNLTSLENLSDKLTSDDGTIVISSNSLGGADLTTSGGSSDYFNYDFINNILSPSVDVGGVQAAIQTNNFFNIKRDGIFDDCYSFYTNTNASISQQWATGLISSGLYAVKDVTNNKFPILINPNVNDYAIHLQYLNGSNIFGYDAQSFSSTDYMKFGSNYFVMNKSGVVGINTLTDSMISTDLFKVSSDYFNVNTSGQIGFGVGSDQIDPSYLSEWVSGHKFLYSGDTILNSNAWLGWNAYSNTGFKNLTSANAFLLNHNSTNNSIDFWLSTEATADNLLYKTFSVQIDVSGISYNPRFESRASDGGSCSEVWRVGLNTANRTFSGGFYEICKDGDQFTDNSAFSIDIINESVRQIRNIQTQTLKILTLTAGTYNNIDISEYGAIYIDDSAGDVKIQGFVGGVDNQILFIDKKSNTNIFTLQRNYQFATQKIFTSSGTDAIYTDLGPILLYNNPVDNTWHVRNT